MSDLTKNLERAIDLAEEHCGAAFGEARDDLAALLAALEAAREDACVSLVADIRFACGDNGKRMQPELVEFIRELAEDAERLDFVMRHVRGWELRRIGIHTNGGDYRPAIDQARGKGGGAGGGEWLSTDREAATVSGHGLA